MIVLIDGDLITYPVAATCELEGAKEVAEHRCNDAIERLLYELSSDDYELYIRGDRRNHRHDIYPEYKANRTKPAPKWLEHCREYLVREWGAQLAEGMETDDRLGIQQTKYQHDSIIASFDKDLLQIPGYHYNFKNGRKTFVSPFDGLRTFYKQIIAGDGADNVPSYDGKIRNSIPKFIEKLQKPIDEMTEELDMWKYVQEVYSLANPENDLEPHLDLQRNARCLYILREEDKYWEEPKNLSLNQGWSQESQSSSPTQDSTSPSS